jgi:hypothetical protein
MRRVIIGLVAVAVMAIAPTGVAMGAAGGERPLKLKLSTTAVVNNTAVVSEGTMRGSQIGNASFEATGTLGSFFPPTTYDDTFTITAANGDQLFGTETGTVSIGAGGIREVPVIGTITGGTGRFEGASGTWTGTIFATVSGLGNLTLQANGTASFTGSIRF